MRFAVSESPFFVQSAISPAPTSTIVLDEITCTERESEPDIATLFVTVTRTLSRPRAP